MTERRGVDVAADDEAAAPEAPAVDPWAVMERMSLPLMVWERVEEPGPEGPDGGGARFVLRWANAAFGRMSGRDPDWARGRDACEVCPGHRIPFRELLEEVLATGEGARFERWCEERQRTCQGHVFRTGEGLVSMVMVDVSSHVEQQVRAAEAARVMRERLDALPVLVYELDGQGNAVYWNRETARALELPAEPHEPRGLDQVVAPESLELARAAVAQIFERDEPLPTLTYDLRSWRGRRVTIQATGRRLDHEGRPPTALIVARDVTRERRAQEAQEALARSWEPTARSRLRHDLNNLLGRIMAAASLVEMEETLSEAGARHLEMVLGACEEAADVIARDRADDKGPP